MTAFAGVIGVGTLLLALPAATAGPAGAPLLTALFTATSAVCVTGLIVVDTPSYWSGFGQGVILGLIQLGGFGIMSLASLVAMLLSRRLSIRRRMVAQMETGALQLGDVRRVLLGVAGFSILFEGITAVVLAARLGLSYGEPAGRALYLGVFHAVSAFNNAGFTLYSDSLTGFAHDPWINLSVVLAFVVGGLGFPVLVDVRRRPWEPTHWSLHTKLTLFMTMVLLVVGIVAVLGFEWDNPATLGPMTVGDKLLAGVFQGATPRTAGFNTLDYGAMDETTWLVTSALMFIGGASASTAGGIKVTTFALLGFVIWSELRGEPEVQLFGRRVAPSSQRQALAVALIGVAVVVGGTFLLMALSSFPLSRVMFEAFSAFGTVGLSTGITDSFGSGARIVLVVLMFVGRTGPWALAAALVLGQRRRLYRYPEERPIIG